MAPAWPADFRWLPSWLGDAEAAALFAAVLEHTPWEDPVLRIAGRLVPMPRRVGYYGRFDYAYSGLVHRAREVPPHIDGVLRRAADEAEQPFNTVLVNLYRSGADSVSWHSDDDYAHAGHPAVGSLSLGATRRFRIAHKRDAGLRFALELTSGGLLVMAGRSQIDWRHSLPKVAAAGARINLTFRYMAESNV